MESSSIHLKTLSPPPSRGREAILKIGILHSPVYTFFEKACIIELNADVEIGNWKSGNAFTSLYFSNFKFPISLPKYKINKV